MCALPHAILLALAASLAVGGQPEKTPPRPAPPLPPPSLDAFARTDPSSKKSVDALLLEIAREYKSYTRVSDAAHWAPELCIVLPPAGVLESASKDTTTHGKKLYFLYARDEKNYNDIGWSSNDEKPGRKPFTAAVGQVVVKESFKPVEVEVKGPQDIPAPPKPDPDDPNRGLVRPRQLPEDYTLDAAGRLYHTGDPAGLFIMAKLADAANEATDNGWIYATISPDLKSVTASGKIESCMECHTKTKHDRLFGPKWLQEREAHAPTGRSPDPLPQGNDPGHNPRAK